MIRLLVVCVVAILGRSAGAEYRQSPEYTQSTHLQSITDDALHISAAPPRMVAIYPEGSDGNFRQPLRRFFRKSRFLEELGMEIFSLDDLLPSEEGVWHRESGSVGLRSTEFATPEAVTTRPAAVMGDAAGLLPEGDYYSPNLLGNKRAAPREQHRLASHRERLLLHHGEGSGGGNSRESLGSAANEADNVLSHPVDVEGESFESNDFLEDGEIDERWIASQMKSRLLDRDDPRIETLAREIIRQKKRMDNRRLIAVLSDQNISFISPFSSHGRMPPSGSDDDNNVRTRTRDSRSATAVGRRAAGTSHLPAARTLHRRRLLPTPNTTPAFSAARNDPYADLQWYLGVGHRNESAYDTQAQAAWEIYTPWYPSLPVTVAIIDSGIDPNHPDVSRSLWVNRGEIPDNGIDDDGNGYIDDVNGYDFKARSGRLSDEDGHGTHLAGLLAGAPNDGRGISGICPNCRVMSLKFMDTRGNGSWADAVEAVNYAMKMGVKITCNSYGAYATHPGLKEAIRRAGRHDLLFVAAAGNEANDNDVRPKLPASHRDLPNVISVASIGQSGKLSEFSNYGRESAHIGAPGEGILSTRSSEQRDLAEDAASRIVDWDGPSYSYLDGTSQAVPLVAGVAAMVWASWPPQSAQQVKTTLLKSVRPVPGLPVRAGGTLSAYRALRRTATHLREIATGTSNNETRSCADFDPCVIDATCTDQGAKRSCDCNAGLEGDGAIECTDVNECLRGGACAPSATCVNTWRSYECECRGGVGDGYTTCELLGLCPLFNPCAEHAMCHAGKAFGLPQCGCKNGYSGDGVSACSDVDECLDDNAGCQHNCVNTDGGFHCSCDEGFVLAEDGKTCLDVDECAADAVPANGGCAMSCTNKLGGRVCGCAEGYALDSTDETSCIDIDECSAESRDPCGPNEICFNLVGGYTCECLPGFQRDAETWICADINECADGAPDTCDHECWNEVGGYRCSCFAGYELASDGVTCIDIDECSVFAGDLLASALGLGGGVMSGELRCSHFCDNLEGGYVCGCPLGLELDEDAHTCIDIDECALGIDGCSHGCINSHRGYECNCPEGWRMNEGDGRTCEDTNECLEGSSTCHHLCRNLEGSFECGCFDGYRLTADGRHCELSNAEGLCHSRAYFSEVDGSGACACFDGYEGDGVEECVDVDECAGGLAICPDSSECVNLDGGYECACLEGYAPDASSGEMCVEELLDGYEAELSGSRRTGNRQRSKAARGGDRLRKASKANIAQQSERGGFRNAELGGDGTTERRLGRTILPKRNER